MVFESVAVLIVSAIGFALTPVTEKNNLKNRLMMPEYKSIAELKAQIEAKQKELDELTR